MAVLEHCLAAEIVAGDIVTLGDIASQFAVAPSTALRWILRGLPAQDGRVKLAACRRGKKWLTSRAALARFLAAMEHEPHAALPAPRSPSKRERDSERAKQTLKTKYGI